ncbi:FadR/GntR family transcriptional regulator [Naumannella halotolerans]|uniref:FadR/GntR family transcriptional regulator n=1 Tax=Naumannella halotolerans TaxID=993414 RepID=UPI00370D98D9
MITAAAIAAISAAEQGSEALEPVRRSLARMEAAGADRERFNDADTAFHLAIAEAGGNDLVAALTAAIRGSVRHRILAAMQTQSHWEDVVEQLLSEHRAILAALEAGEPQRAAELSEQHIRSAARTLW